MSLFNLKGKKEEQQTCGCRCGCNAEETVNVSAVDGNASENGIQSIKALSAGCISCHKQYENAKKAVAEMGLDLEVKYITDMEKVMTYGVMSMPAIVINEKVVSMGRVLGAKELAELFKA